MAETTVHRPRNEYKVLELRAGSTEPGAGADWIAALCSALGISDADEFFAPGLDRLVGLEGNTTFRITTEAEIKPAMAPLLEKLKGSPMGRVARGINAAAGFIGGSESGEDSAANAESERRSFVESLGLPPNVRYQTELSLMPAWNGTSAVRLESITFKFTMGMTGAWDARREVYNPVIALAAANLPRRLSAESSGLRGPLPTPEVIFGEVVRGMANTIGDALGNADPNPFAFEQAVSSVMRRSESAVERELYSGRWSGIWSAKIGRMQLPDFYVKGTSHQFSTDTDENGFPIWGEVTWSDIQSIRMATRNLPLYGLYGPDNKRRG